MLAEYKQATKDLYNTDYHLWVLTTVKHLEHQQFESLDLQNLIEEISDLSRRDQRKMESLLTLIFEHLLKLKYWSLERERNQAHWEAEILNFRKQLQRLLKASPSLKSHLVEIFDECYQDGREIAATRSRINLDTFPQEAIANLEQVLDQNWLPSLVD